MAVQLVVGTDRAGRPAVVCVDWRTAPAPRLLTSSVCPSPLPLCPGCLVLDGFYEGTACNLNDQLPSLARPGRLGPTCFLLLLSL